MRMFHRAGLLSLCAAVLLALAAPAGAEGGDGAEVRYFYDPDPLPFQAWLWPGEGLDSIDSIRSLYQRGGDEAWADFGVEWDRDAFDASLEAGALTFPIGGTYTGWYLDWQEQELWDQGLIQIEAGTQPTLEVHIRPEGLVSQLEPREELPPLSVSPTAAFADAGFPDSIEMAGVPGSEGAAYDTEPVFSVAWSEADYLAGLASGAAEFRVSGEYLDPKEPELGGALWEYLRYQALWEAGDVAFPAPLELTVRVMEAPAQPLVYESWRGEDALYYAAVAAGTPFDALGDAVPAVQTLYGVERGDGLDFLLRWDEEAYRAGMESGAESFQVPGTYALADEAMQGWLEAGLIRTELPPNSLVVQVVGAESSLLRADTVKLRTLGGGIAPAVLLPSLYQAARVSAAYSTDDQVWRETEIEPSYFQSYDAPDWYNIGVYDDHDEIYGVDPDGPVYLRVSVTGSAWEGEWRYTMNEKGDKPPNVNEGDDDDQGGDHGGGGQGEHARPGRSDGEASPVFSLAALARLRGQVADLLDRLFPRRAEAEPPAATPETETELPPEPPAVPGAAPSPEPSDTPAPSAPATGPVAPQTPDGPAAPVAAVPAPPAAAAVSPRPAAPEPERSEPPVSASPPPAEPEISEGVPSPAPSQEVRPTPGPEGQEPAGHVPGFAVAGVGTAALVMAAAWFVWRGGKK